MKFIKHLWVLLYCILLCSFTVYVLLDTFVLTKAFSQETETPSAYDGEITEETESPLAPVITDTLYRDPNILITITEHRYADSNAYVADIVLSSAEYLKTAFAQNTYGRNIAEETSVIAAANGAILAINGDFYGSQERGYVIRNGVLYRKTVSRDRQDLVIYEDGSFEVIMEKEISAEELLESGACHVLSFGPVLVQNGKADVPRNGLRGHATQYNPRTAIGIIDDLHYVFATVDGRTKDSRGMTAYELAMFMESLGVTTAYNLDGGGSATIYFNGKVINEPTYNGKDIEERKVSDIVYIGY